ncbi:D-glutamate cyclase family protein [Nocardia sp. NPDC057353]|uniref:D-glutamate cyclase family protein n=1 Tax=Nocardia sp. NPDC057353 TaxID=3346104 RepID=UPI003625296A
MTGAALLPGTPRALRAVIADGTWTGPTAGILDGHQQANLVVVPATAAAEFAEYCAANPSVCPLLARSEPGDPHLTYRGCTVDVRTELPRYRIWRDAELIGEPLDLTAWWPGDAVAFALGCSHTLDGPLRRAGIPVAATAPPVYVTALETAGATRFTGPVAVSMRPVDAALVDAAVRLTAALPTGHGAPVHVGDPGALGIADLARPEYGVFPGIRDGQVPVYWNCGVTPQLALAKAGLPYAATHYPGHMLVFDAEVAP